VGDIVQRINAEALTPALVILGPRFDTLEARVLQLTIGLQESRLIAHDQVDPANLIGPALGLWQCERNGVAAVLRNEVTRPHALALCEARGVAPTTNAVWRALATDDVLAAGVARLLLYANPQPLPELGRGVEAWNYYVDTWRPGKPKRRTWDGFYGQVMGLLA
jgi:hypothetical protein